MTGRNRACQRVLASSKTDRHTIGNVLYRRWDLVRPRRRDNSANPLIPLETCRIALPITNTRGTRCRLRALKKKPISLLRDFPRTLRGKTSSIKFSSGKPLKPVWQTARRDARLQSSKSAPRSDYRC